MYTLQSLVTSYTHFIDNFCSFLTDYSRAVCCDGVKSGEQERQGVPLVAGLGISCSSWMTSVTDRMNTRSNIPHGSAEDEAESEITVSTGVATRTRGKSDTQHLVCDDKPGQAGASAPSPVRRSGRMKDKSVSQTNLREGLAEWEAARLSHQSKSPNSNKSPAINKTFKVMSPANTDMRKKKALVASSGHRRRDAGRHKMASSLLKGAKSRASMHGHYNRKDRSEGTKGHGASRPKRNIPKIVVSF